MFKKLINDEKSEEWNILMFTLITFAIYFLIFTPIVIFGMMQDPEGLEILMYQPKTDAEINEKLRCFLVRNFKFHAIFSSVKL